MNNFKNIIGIKFFKEVEDDKIKMIRIVRVPNNGDDITKGKEITVQDEVSKEQFKMKVSEFKTYTPLEPDGYLTIAKVSGKNVEGKEVHDIVVTASKILEMKYAGNLKPYVILRQSVTDLMAADGSQDYVGMSISRDNCPEDFDYLQLLGCDEILNFRHFNFYRTDTLERDILPLINTKIFDDTLEELFKIHIETSGNFIAQDNESDHGWCRKLSKLLEENNFQADIDEMLGITHVDFKLANFIVEKELPGKEGEYFDSPSDDFLIWLQYTYQVKMEYATIIKFGHDINLADFNDSLYLLIRDSESILYLIVYTNKGEFFEEDLKAVATSPDFTTKFKIKMYNKYHNKKK